MGFVRVVTELFAQKKTDEKAVKSANAGKDWAILNTADKFEIIGQDLLARGIIDTL